MNHGVRYEVKKGRKTISRLVIVTDYGQVLIPAEVEAAYLRFNLQKRAPNRSKRLAEEMLSCDVRAMARFYWFMGKDLEL